MTTFALISCSKTKLDRRSRAEELYSSALFRKSLLNALSRKVPYFILSAKYGLLSPDECIDPYDVTLKQMPECQREAWGASVAEAISAKFKSGDVALLLTGNTYRQSIEPHLRRLGISVVAPLSGKSLGQRLAVLREENEEEALRQQYQHFYRVMTRLYRAQNGGIPFASTTGHLDWPTRGVYFLLEDTERNNKPFEFRITRVGTHAVSSGSRTTLWDRLATHRGVGNGSGSHRSSIFRLHVGRSIIASGGHANISTWGAGQVADRATRDDETTLEREVTKVIGRMRVLVVAIGDDPGPSSDRSYVERNAIGLLSRAAVLHPRKSRTWLGNWSASHKISTSGLWNLNHLYDVPDPQFVDVLEQYVDVTLGKTPHPAKSIAPRNWHRAKKQNTKSRQLKLFSGDPF
jgi:hypothetical protein